MGLATTYSRALVGVEAPLVTVETHLSNGLPAFNIVGLPEAAVKESKERVRSAIINSGLQFPDRRITVNLGPADLPKAGGRYDLAIAAGILGASAQLPLDRFEQFEMVGELGLNGDVRSVTGCLSAILAARDARRKVLLPQSNQIDARQVQYTGAGLVDSLLTLFSELMNGDSISYIQAEEGCCEAIHHKAENSGHEASGIDLCEVKGQYLAKKALAVAAAGGHNLMMIGPPGTGKTLLATILPTLLPNLDERRALEVAVIYSVAGKKSDTEHWRRPPFRSPHHTATAVALTGGSSRPKPGEVSLAHNGILFLDELPEFSTRVLEVLREPVESGEVSISRAGYQVSFPARFQLIAAMNPCPCGYFGDSVNECRCTPEKITRYRSKISGPFLDRFDIRIEVPRFTPAELLQLSEQEPEITAETSEMVRTKIEASQKLQRKRQGKLNSEINGAELEEHCRLDTKTETYFHKIASDKGLSFRALHRIRRLARTLADMQEAENISIRHVQEALSQRTTLGLY